MNRDDRSVSEFINEARAIIYDFDGPVCDVFSGTPASRIARELTSVAGHEVATDDPLEVIRSFDGKALEKVEDALISAEMKAVDVSQATPGGLESIQAAFQAGRRVAIVSNNSAASVERFLSRVGIGGRVWPVIGRAYRMPERMKPDPWPMCAALDALALAPNEVVFVGDSITDVEVARVCRVPCIGYANKPGKSAAMVRAGAVVIDSMWAVQRVLAAGK